MHTQVPARRIRTGVLLTALLGAVSGPSAGCRTELRGDGSAGLAAPARTATLDLGRLQAVRERARAHDRAGALELLEPDRPLEASDPERCWLLVALWREVGARSHAARAVDAMPPGSLRTTLVAFTRETPREALSILGQGPGHDGWADLVRSHVLVGLGDLRGSRDAADRAARAPWLLVRIDGLLVAAALHAELGDLAAARSRLASVRELAPWDARGAHETGLLERRVGRPRAAAEALLEGLATAPASETVARDLHDTWRTLAPGADRDRLGRAALALQASGNPAWEALASAVALDVLDDPLAAEQHARRALAAGALPVPTEHDLRRALFAQGRYREAVAILQAALPPDVRAAPENLVGPCWEALAAAVAAAPDRSAADDARVVLARALLALGAHADALIVLDGARGAQARSLVRRLEGHIAFERALADILRAGYADAARDESPADLDGVLARVPGLARRHLAPRDAAALADVTTGVSSVPLLGAWVDHGVRATSPLVRHFRAHGRYLVLGQRARGPVEAVVLSLAYLAEDVPLRTTGFVHRHDVAIGIDRGLGTAVVAEGGELGGACLPDALWLDADSARTSDAAWRRVLVRDPATMRFAHGPPPPVGAEGRLALTDPAGVTERLVARVARQRGTDPWSSWFTLRAHEAGHVTDLRTHLPVLQGLPASIRLLAKAGGSFHDVERHLECQAQLAAVVDARDPALAVAEMTAMLPVVEPDAEVHRGGYHDALQRMLRHIDRHPLEYPGLDRTKRLLPQLDRLDDAALRRAAWNAWRAGR